MASLIGDAGLAGVHSGAYNIRNPGSGFIGALLDTVSDLGKSAINLQQNKGINEAATDAYKAMAEQDKAASGVPTDVQEGVTKLDTISAARDQGKTNQSALDLELQNQAIEKMNKYPTQAAQIAQFYQSAGYDHYMFQHVKSQEDQAMALSSAKSAVFIEDYKYGAENGAQPGMTDQETAAYGRNLRVEHNKLDVAKQEAQVQKDLVAAGDEHAKFVVQTAKDKMVNAIWSEAQIKMNPMIDSLRQQVLMANDNPKYQNQVDELAPLVQQTVDSYRQSIRATAAKSGLSPSDMKPVEDQLDAVEKSVKETFSGSMSQRATNEAILKNIQNTFHLDNFKAFPVFSQLKDLVGAQTLAFAFGPNGVPLPKETIEALTQEFNGYSTSNPAAGRIAVQQAAATLRKELKISQVSPENIPVVVSTNMNAVWGNTNAIIGGDKTQDTKEKFSNAYENIIDASHSIQPVGSPDLNSIISASSVVANTKSRAVVEQMIADPFNKDRGEVLMLGSRGAAENLLQASRNANVPNSYADSGRVQIEHGQSVQLNAPYKGTVEFDGKTGYYYVKKDGSVPDYVLKGLEQKAKTQNALLNHLVNTSQYDKELPQGATPLSLRKYYNSGATLVNAKGQPLVNPQENADQKAQESLSSFRKSLQQVPGQVAEEGSLPTLSAPVADAQLWQESRYDQKAVSDQGAVGIAQIVPKWYPEYDPEKLKTDEAYSIKARDEIMSKLLAKYGGNETLALMEYHGGPDTTQWGPKTIEYAQIIMKRAQSGKTRGTETPTRPFEENKKALISKSVSALESDETMKTQYADSFIKNYDYGALIERNPIAYLGFLNGGTDNINYFKTPSTALALTFSGEPTKANDPDYDYVVKLLKEAGLSPKTAAGKIVLGPEFGQGKNTNTLEHELMHRGLNYLESVHPQLKTAQHNLIYALEVARGFGKHTHDLEQEPYAGFTRTAQTKQQREADVKLLASIFKGELEKAEKLAKQEIDKRMKGK